PHIFSAGLDVKEIFAYDEAGIRNFFQTFGLLHKELVQFTKPQICAINGHSPAGGTVLAVAADYRIMAEGEKFLIGLNEMAVNIQITQTLVYAYGFWLGTSTANEFLLDGKLMDPDEAQACGLVNQVVPQGDVLATAERQMKKYLAAHPDIFANTKRKIRKDWLAQREEGEDQELEEIIRLWWMPSVRERMGALVASLSGGK
ncbi:MAG TPA: enoyl-CoA hydratase/isomerase family protein, partial [Cytophagales bacterium]|nr:enoyl-CoA hydratase/isomerase family protein [Cytophagales bacterium]